MLLTNVFWLAFVAFAALVLGTAGDVEPFAGRGPLWAGKFVVWLVFAAFLGYTAWCSAKENLFRSVGAIAQLHWGRQIGLDLYVGLTLALFIVYLNEGSLAVALLWLVPCYVYGNLATLLYVAVHYDELVARFFG